MAKRWWGEAPERPITLAGEFDESTPRRDIGPEIAPSRCPGCATLSAEHAIERRLGSLSALHIVRPNVPKRCVNMHP
jgi:hypothetical protein